MRTHTVVGPKVLNALLASREFMGFLRQVWSAVG